jgi:hypothetical protein
LFDLEDWIGELGERIHVLRRLQRTRVIEIAS